MAKEKIQRRPPAVDLENRENELINLAEKIAEEQLRNGTASSQIITHYLKLGSMKERTEREVLNVKKDLLVAQKDNLKESTHFEKVYEEALEAFKSYSGKGDDDYY